LQCPVLPHSIVPWGSQDCGQLQWQLPSSLFSWITINE
jgi:hypothetical protein